LQFRFRKSAFKHGFTEADIRHAFETCRYLDRYKNRENVYLLLGCQKQFFHLFKREEIL
jgi:hypothetical protein